jgi:hypothetical protein
VGHTSGTPALARHAAVLRATEQHGAGALGGGQGELIERHALAASGEDAGTGASSEVERANLHLRHNLQTRVIRDGANDDGGLGGLALHELVQLRKGQRGPVDACAHQPLLDHLVELGVGTAGQELVQLYITHIEEPIESITGTAATTKPS